MRSAWLTRLLSAAAVAGALGTAAVPSPAAADDLSLSLGLEFGSPRLAPRYYAPYPVYNYYVPPPPPVYYYQPRVYYPRGYHRPPGHYHKHSKHHHHHGYRPHGRYYGRY